MTYMGHLKGTEQLLMLLVTPVLFLLWQVDLELQKNLWAQGDKSCFSLKHDDKQSPDKIIFLQGTW